MPRIYPAFGRELMDARRAGDHPVDELILIALNFWPKVGDEEGAWPRRRALAIFDGQVLSELELRMLSGLNVLIACDACRFHRAKDLARFVMNVRPAKAMVWILDFETPRFWRLLECIWSDLTAPELEYWLPIANTVIEYAIAHLRRNKKNGP